MVDAFTLHDSHASTLLGEGVSGQLVCWPVEEKLKLRHLAGLEVVDHWTVHWRPSSPTAVRYWFDCWPQPWMGLTVAEELAFGLQDVDATAALAMLRRWQLDDLALDAAVLELARFDAVRLMLAHAELGGCDLLLMEQPDVGLTDDEVQSLLLLLQAWLQRSAVIAVVTSHRFV